jgi:hypothetical protein
MRQIKSAISVVLGLLIFTSVIGLVSADGATRGFVWTTIDGDDDNWETDFLVYQNIYINWIARPSLSTVDISVTFQDLSDVPLLNVGPPEQSETGDALLQAESGTIFFVPTQPGKYTIHMEGYADIEIAVATVLVAPESVFGALSAVGAGVAAFGAFAVIKKRKSSILPF